MKVPEKYKKVFGQIDSLAEAVPWSTGVSNMLEWLTWSTNDVLGVTKTQYRKLIVELSHDHALRDSTLEEKQGFVKTHLDKAIQDSERLDRYDKPASRGEGVMRRLSLPPFSQAKRRLCSVVGGAVALDALPSEGLMSALNILAEVHALNVGVISVLGRDKKEAWNPSLA